FEEMPDTLDRRPRRVGKTLVEDGMDLRHIGIDDLEGEILLVLEVMIERALGRCRRVQQRLNSQVVVAVLQKHAQSGLDQPLLGWRFCRHAAAAAKRDQPSWPVLRLNALNRVEPSSLQSCDRSPGCARAEG